MLKHAEVQLVDGHGNVVCESDAIVTVRVVRQRRGGGSAASPAPGGGREREAMATPAPRYRLDTGDLPTLCGGARSQRVQRGTYFDAI